MPETSFNEAEAAKRVLWALGGKGSTDVGHAYLTESDYKKGLCLCGRKVNPYLKLTRWDLENETVGAHTCPHCRARLQFLDLIDHTDPEQDE